MTAQPQKTSFFQTFNGDQSLVTATNRTGTLTQTGADGTVLVFDSSAAGGFKALSQAQVVTNGVNGGAQIDATSISILTEPGQIVTGGGLNAPNVVLPPGTDGYVLQALSTATPYGLAWVPAASATGSVQPTAGSLVSRDGAGAIYGAGFYASGTITPATGSPPNVVPGNNVQSVGAVSHVFNAMYATTGFFTTTSSTTVTNPTSSLTLSAPTTGSSIVMAVFGAAAALTVSQTAIVATLPVSATTLVVGTLNAANSWTISISGSSLVFSAWNGSTYVVKQTFANA